VLLIDELDRADDEFEAFLLELLSDFQVTIPEIGVVRSSTPPAVVVTSNRTRELHDALKRRCLYHWIEHPSLEREVAIVCTRLPQVPEPLARQVCAFVEGLRWLDLYRVPGVGETLDWAQALTALRLGEVDANTAARTLGTLLKTQEDIERLRRDGLAAVVEQARARAAALGGEDAGGSY
jgi:MoxR-like ATPase